MCADRLHLLCVPARQCTAAYTWPVQSVGRRLAASDAAHRHAPVGVPGAIAAKRVHRSRNVVAVTGDAGFLMNFQEIETALRLELARVFLVWNDSEYGIIKWHQLRHFGRESNIRFNNPDLAAYAESFGARGYRVESTEQLLPSLQRAFEDNTAVLIDCPVDYRENMKLT
ncbi:MAG: thiamine pyrophosphate-dependent enzyme [Gammaproteobacteria bacterium]|nr:thiamine pyrophosphate-dependent enzyme [Gammaproteobacteria bacterium]